MKFIYALFVMVFFCEKACAVDVEYEGEVYNEKPCPFMKHNNVYLQRAPGQPDQNVYENSSFSPQGNQVDMTYDGCAQKLTLSSVLRDSWNFKCGELFMDSFFRDGLKSRKLTYIYPDRTDVEDVSEKIRIGNIEEWASHKPYDLSNIKLYNACGVRFEAPSITIPQTFFRLKKTLEIICPLSIKGSFVREIVITPETFPYTDNREGQDPKISHTSRTFLVKGRVDFQNNYVSLEVYNARLKVFTQDLKYPRVCPQEDKPVQSEGLDVTSTDAPIALNVNHPGDSGVISKYASSSSLPPIPEDSTEGDHGAMETAISTGQHL